MVSPHAQEIEYALALQRIISTVKDDPAQLRLTIYEFARARLNIDTSWAEQSERKRLLAALETAIQGVEEFSARREQKERIQSNPTAQIGQAAAAVASAVHNARNRPFGNPCARRHSPAGAGLSAPRCPARRGSANADAGVDAGPVLCRNVAVRCGGGLGLPQGAAAVG